MATLTITIPDARLAEMAELAIEDEPTKDAIKRMVEGFLRKHYQKITQKTAVDAAEDAAKTKSEGIKVS